MKTSNKKLGEKQWRYQKALDSEVKFKNLCNRHRITSVRLEDDKNERNKYLKNQNGKCPDFLCTNKMKKQIFVEVKTHTHLTNRARHTFMVETIKNKKADGLSGTTLFEPFDPRPELMGVFEGYLRDASKKFKNIKETIPKILFLDGGHHVIGLDVRALFWGAYPSFYQSGEYAGLKKEHRGLFDSTGSNVSAVIYWNDNENRFEGIRNPRALIPFSEQDFEDFFETVYV